MNHTNRLTRFVGTLFFFSALAFASTAFGGPAMSGVAASAAEAHPLKVGATAPNVGLTALNGNTFMLKDLVDGKPSIVIFYRGGWCPYCNAHLADLAKIEDQIKERGYQIIAITPDQPSEIRKTLGKNHLTYKLLSDKNSEAMKQFGVAYRLDDATFNTYKGKYNVDLEKYSNNNRHILPVPSVFVVDKDGKIVFVHSNPDYRIRLKGSELLKALDRV